MRSVVQLHDLPVWVECGHGTSFNSMLPCPHAVCCGHSLRCQANHVELGYYACHLFAYQSLALVQKSVGLAMVSVLMCVLLVATA
jgi:hypothetical protein